MGVSIWEGGKAQDALDKLDNLTLMTAAIVDAISETSDGKGLFFKNFKTLQWVNRMGLAEKVIDDYAYVVVNKETDITIACHGTGITSATIDEKTFVDAVGTAETKEYEIIFDGSSWHLNNEVVLLSAYGITITGGTPAANDTITVDETAEAQRYDVLGVNHDIPSDPNLQYTITLCSHDVKTYGSLAYKKPQGLIYVDPAIFPDGLAAGELYYVNATYSTYDNTTKEDGLYGFTPSVAVPAGGLVRHTKMGEYQASATSYTQARVLAGSFETYGTIATGRQKLETCSTSLVDGQSGTLLGTVTAEDVTKRSADYCNMTRRNAYGSNAYIGSDERAWMQSDAPKGTDSVGLQLWQSGKLGIFDLPASYNAPGNLYGVDPQLLAVIGPVRKRTYLHSVDRTDQSVKFIDTDETVFPLSMLEANFGTTNDDVYENAVDHEGNAKTVPYPYYARRTTAAEKIKYQNGTARRWWLRSPSPSNCHYVRDCGSSGALYDGNAYSAGGAVDTYNIV